MKMRILAAAVVLVATGIALGTAAWARGCPPGTSYQCTQGFNGKVICGCR
jgi:hypothetical protein